MYSDKTWYYNLTDYPKIYNTTYWGNFTFRGDEDLNNIIENRNSFIKEFDIKSHIKSLPKYMLMRCEKHINIGDHVEKYKTNDNKLIILNSPYYLSDKEKQTFKELGYIEVKQMYSKHATTYMFITDIYYPQKPQIMVNEQPKKIIKTLVNFNL